MSQQSPTVATIAWTQMVGAGYLRQTAVLKEKKFDNDGLVVQAVPEIKPG